MPNLAFLPFTPSFHPTKSPYPVWTNSQRADIGLGAREIQPPASPAAERKHLARLYRKARKWKAKDPRIMTQGALRVFECLCFDFANATTGQLFPSHATIAKRCGIGITCVKDALNRLRELGLVHWQRRCVQAVQALGGFILKQITNLYTIFPTAIWEGFEEGEKVPPPEPYEYGGAALTIPHGTEAGLQAAQEAKAKGYSARSATLAGITALADSALTEAERNLAALFSQIVRTEV